MTPAERVAAFVEAHKRAKVYGLKRGDCRIHTAWTHGTEPITVSCIAAVLAEREALAQRVAELEAGKRECSECGEAYEPRYCICCCP